MTIISLLSCNEKQNTNKVKNNLEKIKIEKTENMTNNENNLTLLSGLKVGNVSFSNEKLELKTYKYQDIFIEDIKISDLLETQYRKSFFDFLANTLPDSKDEFKCTFFTKLIFTRITQLRDTNAFFLLSELSKNESLSYNGIALIDDYVFEDLLNFYVFYIEQSSKYNDITILEYILLNIAPQYIKTDSEIRDSARMCYCDDLKSGLILLERNKLETVKLKKFKERFKNEQIIEIDCSPTFATRENTTEEYYDIKSLIDKEMENKLGIKEKIFYKVRITPILKDYITK